MMMTGEGRPIDVFSCFVYFSLFLSCFLSLQDWSSYLCCESIIDSSALSSRPAYLASWLSSLAAHPPASTNLCTNILDKVRDEFFPPPPPPPALAESVANLEGSIVELTDQTTKLNPAP